MPVGNFRKKTYCLMTLKFKYPNQIHRYFVYAIKAKRKKREHEATSLFSCLNQTPRLEKVKH